MLVTRLGGLPAEDGGCFRGVENRVRGEGERIVVNVAKAIEAGNWKAERHNVRGIAFVDDAVVVTTGGGKRAKSASVTSAAEILRRAREGRPVQFTGKVVVKGDGRVALDTARTALRSGATEVVVVTHFQADTMPVDSRHLAAAQEEGVQFEFGAKDTPQGRAQASGMDDTTVIVAEDPAGGRIEADRFTGRTSTMGVFAAGDALGDPKSVIHSVAGGKRTALAVDAWLRGADLAKLEEELASHSALPYLEQLETEQDMGAAARRLAERAPVWLKMGATAEPAARATMPKTGKAKRLSGLDVEVEKGLSLAAAQEEAKRCLQCVCPTSGSCELQKLGVEYGITANELVVKGSRVRTVEPQHLSSEPRYAGLTPHARISLTAAAALSGKTREVEHPAKNRISPIIEEMGERTGRPAWVYPPLRLLTHYCPGSVPPDGAAGSGPCSTSGSPPSGARPCGCRIAAPGG